MGQGAGASGTPRCSSASLPRGTQPLLSLRAEPVFNTPLIIRLPHSSTLAWKIPWMEEPGGLQSMGSLRVGHDWANSLFTFHFHTLEKAMATHSSVLAWRIPGTGEPGGLTSLGSHRVGHDWSDLAAAAIIRLSVWVQPQGWGKLPWREEYGRQKRESTLANPVPGKQVRNSVKFNTEIPQNALHSHGCSCQQISTPTHGGHWPLLRSWEYQIIIEHYLAFGSSMV